MKVTKKVVLEACKAATVAWTKEAQVAQVGSPWTQVGGTEWRVCVFLVVTPYGVVNKYAAKRAGESNVRKWVGTRDDVAGYVVRQINKAGEAPQFSN
jgi:hypothetical protein